MKGLSIIFIIYTLFTSILYSSVSKTKLSDITEGDASYYRDSVSVKEIDKSEIFKDFTWMEDTLKKIIHTMISRENNVNLYDNGYNNEYNDRIFLSINKKNNNIISFTFQLGFDGITWIEESYCPAIDGELYYFKFNDKYIFFRYIYNTGKETVKRYPSNLNSIKVPLIKPIINDRKSWHYESKDGILSLKEYFGG